MFGGIGPLTSSTEFHSIEKSSIPKGIFDGIRPILFIMGASTFGQGERISASAADSKSGYHCSIISRSMVPDRFRT